MTEKQKPTAAPAATETKQPILDPVIEATAKRQTVLKTGAAFLGIAPAKVYDVLRGTWTTTKGTPPLTDPEIWRGLAIVARYELDPFAREIYVTRDKKGRLMIVLGIDGWVRVLDRTDHYAGFKQDWTLEDPKDPDTMWRCETTIYSTKREPTMYTAYMKDYLRLGGYMSGTIPSHMLRIFSFKHAARMFVPLGSVVTEEEARWMGAEQPDAAPAETLDDLTEKMTAVVQDPAVSPVPVYPKAEPEPNPPTPDEVKADQAQLADEFAGEFGKAATPAAITSLRSAAREALKAGRLGAEQAAGLDELAEAATARIKVTK